MVPVKCDWCHVNQADAYVESPLSNWNGDKICRECKKKMTPDFVQKNKITVHPCFF